MKNNFFKMVLASGLGVLLASVVFSILSGIMMVLFVLSLGSSTEKPVKKHSVLTIDLSKPFTEREATTVESLLFDQKTVGFNTILEAIDKAATDKKIEGIYLKDGLTYSAGWATTQELRNALAKFKEESGKFVYAYSDSYSQKSYYLATVADRIFLNPSGMVEFTGIAAEAMFIKDMLDKLDVKVDLIRPNSNAFKSAGEMYTMNKMSEANREQIRTYIKSIWDEVLPQMSEARGISVDSLNYLADNLSAFMADDAFSAGLVDELGFENDVKELMVEQIDKVKSVSKLNFVSVSNYPTEKKTSGKKIAVVYAEGEVQMGKGYDVGVYSTNMVKALDEAANDDDVQAIVLRVNSPGGAVLASEAITDAVVRAKEKKPLIVSMGDLAASAGYEISCYADYIVAQPTTITGSIGVFAMLPEIGTMLKNKIGLTFDTVNTNRNSSALSVMRPLSTESRALMQKNVEDFYKIFIGRVAEGRGLDVNYVDSIARGRVWTGRDALTLGLVDTLGGIDVALAIAAERAGITKYSVKVYPEAPSTLMEMFNMTDEDARAKVLLPTQYGKYRFFSDIEKLCDSDPLQARLPYYINM
ncbi:MAG: signal peptide peptidase SppA [Bacteroidales bacterium]|nr:signal peptide peptidase SppA [Bacteroidales bacterium]